MAISKKKTKKPAPKKTVKKSIKKTAPKKSVKKAPIKKAAPKKAVKKASKKIPAVPAKGLTQEQINERVGQLIEKGRKRRFVTFEEILKYFPDVENDVMFLDDLYVKLGDAGIDVIQTGGLLAMEDEGTAELAGRRYDRNASANDSVQLYLKEIGKYQIGRAHV